MITPATTAAPGPSAARSITHGRYFPVCVVGLGPNPDRPDDTRTPNERAADALQALGTLGGNLPPCALRGVGVWHGTSEPVLVLVDGEWTVEAAKVAGRAAGQQCIYSHVPGTAAALVYTDGSGRGWVPLGSHGPADAGAGSFTSFEDTNGTAWRFSAGPGPGRW